MKRLMFPTLLISLGAVAGYWVASDDSSKVFNPETLISDLQSENAALKAQLVEVKKLREHTTLRKNSSDPSVDSQLKPGIVKADVSPIASTTDQSKFLTLEQKIALMDTESFVRDISQRMQKVGHQEFIGERREQFSREVVDPIWAQAEEEDIYEIFLSAPELADVALVNTECKSLQCRVSLSVATTERSNEAIADLSRLLAKDKGNLYHWVNYDPAKSITEVYITTHSRSFNSDGSNAAN